LSERSTAHFSSAFPIRAATMPVTALSQRALARQTAM
jgi:hypothetical protein